MKAIVFWHILSPSILGYSSVPEMAQIILRQDNDQLLFTSHCCEGFAKRMASYVHSRNQPCDDSPWI